MISQLTVFLENEEGRLASAVRTIANANINMQALFLADTADFGILRIFCDTPQKACDALTAAGYRARQMLLRFVWQTNQANQQILWTILMKTTLMSNMLIVLLWEILLMMCLK